VWVSTEHNTTNDQRAQQRQIVIVVTICKTLTMTWVKIWNDLLLWFKYKSLHDQFSLIDGRKHYRNWLNPGERESLRAPLMVLKHEIELNIDRNWSEQCEKLIPLWLYWITWSWLLIIVVIESLMADTLVMRLVRWERGISEISENRSFLIKKTGAKSRTKLYNFSFSRW
jgi:hypothetical protein